VAAPEETQRRGSSDWTPSETRLTPEAATSRNRPASTEVGFASSVISTSGDKVQRDAARSSSAATVPGAISEGVPPPKKIATRFCPLFGSRNGRAR